MDYPSAAVPTVNLDPITGKFTKGNSGTGQPASTDRPEDMNQVFDEMLAVIADGGIVKDQTVFTQVRDAIRAMISGRTNSGNGFIDPCCRVSQLATPNLSTARQYGAVDMVQAWASGGAVAAGTIAQDASGAAGGKTPYSVHLTGVTLTGAGAISFRKWLGQDDAQAYIGQAAYVAVRVLHTVGAPINTATITVNKANAANNFAGGVTLIQASANLAINSGVSTVLFFAIPAMGACGNGIEMILTLPTGAIVTKDFYATDFQISLGTSLAPFEVPKFNTDILNVQHWLEKTYEYGTLPGSAVNPGLIQAQDPSSINNGAGFLNGAWRFAIRKGVTPAITLYSKAGTSGKVTFNNADSAATVNVDTTGLTPLNNSGGVLAAAITFQFHAVADARL